MTNKKSNIKKPENVLSTFRTKWPRGKISLLACHIFYAIDETRDWGGWLDTADMDEGEKMFLELISDLHKLVPEERCKVNVSSFEKEVLEQEGEDEDDLL